MHLINIQYTRLGLNEVGEHCRLGRAWADLSRKFHNESGNDESDWLDLLLDDGELELMGTATRVMAYNELLQLLPWRFDIHFISKLG